MRGHLTPARSFALSGNFSSLLIYSDRRKVQSAGGAQDGSGIGTDSSRMKSFVAGRRGSPDGGSTTA